MNDKQRTTLSHHWPVTSRREFFTRAGSGLAGMALASMLRAEAQDPLASKKPHHAPKAKSIIWLFMEGGPSHVDLFDPKPKLLELGGQPIPESMRPEFTAMTGTSHN